MRLDVRPLDPEHAVAATELVAGDPTEYRLHFSGLPKDPADLEKSIRAADLDAYWGIWTDPEVLAGIFMLRGLDEGFSSPAFGVYIGSEFSGIGLGRLAIQHSICHCRLCGIPEIMLTVADENAAAVKIYESVGFLKTDEPPPRGQPIYRLTLRDLNRNPSR